jgi:hypothetical protein
VKRPAIEPASIERAFTSLATLDVISWREVELREVQAASPVFCPDFRRPVMLFKRHGKESCWCACDPRVNDGRDQVHSNIFGQSAPGAVSGGT